MSDGEFVTYTLVMDKKVASCVDILANQLGLKSKAEVCDLAITLLSWTTEKIKQGYAVGGYRDGEFIEVSLRRD